MPWIRDRYRELQRTIGRNMAERDVTDEIETHIAMRIEENVARGMNPEAARAEALRRFGNVREVARRTTRIEESTQQQRRRSEWLQDVIAEVGRAARALRRAPVFAVTALLALTLGLGAASAVFTVLDGAVLRPLPFPNADRLAWVWHPTPKVKEDQAWPLSEAGYFYFVQNNRSFSSLAAIGAGDASVIINGVGERVRIGQVSANAFETLGIRVILGRGFAAGEDRPNAAPAALLGYDLWRDRFSGNRNIIGSTIEFEGTPIRIIGVTAQGARLPTRPTSVQIWIPYTLNPNATPVNWHRVETVGRLSEGKTIEQAQADLERLTSQFSTVFPAVYPTEFFRDYGFRTQVLTLRDFVLGKMGNSIWLMFGFVVLVLLIACVNVANLFLVRADVRRREAAVRAALGAGRLRLALHFFAESIVLTTIAGIAALGVAALALRVFVATAPEALPRLDEIALRPLDVILTLSVSAVIGVGLTLVQVLHASGSLALLREGGRGSTATRAHQRVRGALVAGQLALALVLLAAAGVMTRSVMNLRSARLGFQSENVLVADIALPRARYSDFEAVHLASRQLVRTIEGWPDVERAAISATPAPMEGSQGPCNALRFAQIPKIYSSSGPSSTKEGTLRCIPVPQVTPGYFAALGVPVEGQAPTWEDADAGAAGVVITRHLAARLWPGESPIGKEVGPGTFEAKLYRITGVVDEMRGEGLAESPVQAMYFPVKQNKGAAHWGPRTEGSLLIRTRGADPVSLAPRVRQAIAALDPTITVANPRTLQSMVNKSAATATFLTVVLGISAAMALVLSAVGLFGVIAYVVVQRRAEIGIRMALGASDTKVVQMVTRQAITLAIIGVVIGLLMTIPVVRSMQSLLYGISPTDPYTLTFVALVLVLVSAAAGYIPARRAASIDPAEALR
jgi:putative ABC transport system permease protein